MSEPMLKLIWNAVQPSLSAVGKVVIAGGSARDTLMNMEPKDFDVFVNCNEEQSMRILNAMQAFEGVTVPEYHKSEPFLVGTWLVLGRVVQVMWTPHDTLSSLVGSFDWNVSLFAYDGEFHAWEQTSNINTEHSLKLNKITYPVSTLRRGFRFSERFGMKLERADLLKLCRAILATEPEQQAEEPR